MRPRPTTGRIVGGILVIILSAVGADAQPAVPVVANTVKSGDVPIYLTGIGHVQAYNTVTVRSQIQGQITQIAFTEGQAVHIGDLLAQIDPRPYQATLDQTIANRNRDQADLGNAQANLNRNLPLLSQGFATQQLVDNERAQIAELTAAVQSDEAAIEAAQVQLSYTRLTSPINGVTGIRQIDIGNIIHPTDANGLVVVTQLQPISVIFTLPQTDLMRLQQHMAHGSLTVVAYGQDRQTQLDQGTLLLLDNQIDQATGTLQLKANFPNASGRLWPGELVNARLLIDTRHDGLTIASTAVQEGPEGKYVFVVMPDNSVAIRSIATTHLSDGIDLVDSGLSAGEQVVVEGQSRLQSGSHVTILTGKAAKSFAAENTQAVP
ncbi:MAG TPA: efflux RND transporter periplasmic adaptor subunit [Acetobacteraceae bacterium]|nr:efflux RND transporter periplasmic adaptor subunit [Acetobacteraceae bacterium]